MFHASKQQQQQQQRQQQKQQQQQQQQQQPFIKKNPILKFVQKKWLEDKPISIPFHKIWSL